MRHALRAACTLAATLCLSPARAEGPPPNILLIVADDVGFTDIGPFGSEIETPALDALAAEGLRLTDFHTSVSCSPTRAMLLTGVDNHVAGIGAMAEMIANMPPLQGKPGYEGYLNHDVVTLPEVLRQAGYDTYMAGKWHLGDAADNIPAARGFDRSFALMGGGASHFADMSGIQANAPVAEYYLDDERLDALSADFYSTRSYADFLMDAIRAGRDDGKPFFAYFAPTAAHDPVQVPDPWLGKYAGRYDAGYEALRADRIAATKVLGIVPEAAPDPGLVRKVRPWAALTPEEQAYEARVMEAYAGMVDNLDYHIGRIVAFLKDIGEYDNTIIVFLTDNGANPFYASDYPGNAGSEFMAAFDNGYGNIGRPGSFVSTGPGWALASSGPLDYFKLTVGEGGIRTPFIAAGPGIAAGQSSDGFAYVMDVMPTLLAMTGIAHPDAVDGHPVAPMGGRSLVPVLSGAERSAYGPEDAAAGELAGDMWIRRGDYKADFVGGKGWKWGPDAWQLYDVTQDPGGVTDLSAEMPELMSELQALWNRWADTVGVVRLGN